MSAFLVERNYVLWRGTDVSAGIAEIPLPRLIQRTNSFDELLKDS